MPRVRVMPRVRAMPSLPSGRWRGLRPSDVGRSPVASRPLGSPVSDVTVLGSGLRRARKPYRCQACLWPIEAVRLVALEAL